jgi:hypothetical protein
MFTFNFYKCLLYDYINTFLIKNGFREKLLNTNFRHIVIGRFVPTSVTYSSGAIINKSYFTYNKKMC